MPSSGGRKRSPVGDDVAAIPSDGETQRSRTSTSGNGSGRFGRGAGRAVFAGRPSRPWRSPRFFRVALPLAPAAFAGGFGFATVALRPGALRAGFAAAERSRAARWAGVAELPRGAVSASSSSATRSPTAAIACARIGAHVRDAAEASPGRMAVTQSSPPCEVSRVVVPSGEAWAPARSSSRSRCGGPSSPVAASSRLTQPARSDDSLERSSTERRSSDGSIVNGSGSTVAVPSGVRPGGATLAKAVAAGPMEGALSEAGAGARLVSGACAAVPVCAGASRREPPEHAPAPQASGTSRAGMTDRGERGDRGRRILRSRSGLLSAWLPGAAAEPSAGAVRTLAVGSEMAERTPRGARCRGDGV
ncbi:hypothetical protein WME73_50325 [Sorangium sp. So ce302]|uniref:hypothetical protein n=1 Tax=Sorangium sp. So ce302 TaxID=3133297 RepID=UPI003F636A0B